MEDTGCVQGLFFGESVRGLGSTDGGLSGVVVRLTPRSQRCLVLSGQFDVPKASHGLSHFLRLSARPASSAGQRHSLPSLLWLIFLATDSDYVGYREINQFRRSNAAFFISYFALNQSLPSHVSVLKLVQVLDKTALAQAGSWVAGAGQSLRSTRQRAQEPVRVWPGPWWWSRP